MIVLVESADRALDHETTRMQDWSFIESYILSTRALFYLGKMYQLPLIGRFFRNYLFRHFQLSYDIILNFIEGHEEATRIVADIVQSYEFISIIHGEAHK